MDHPTTAFHRILTRQVLSSRPLGSEFAKRRRASSYRQLQHGQSSLICEPRRSRNPRPKKQRPPPSLKSNLHALIAFPRVPLPTSTPQPQRHSFVRACKLRSAQLPCLPLLAVRGDPMLCSSTVSTAPAPAVASAPPRPIAKTTEEREEAQHQTSPLASVMAAALARLPPMPAVPAVPAARPTRPSCRCSLSRPPGLGTILVCSGDPRRIRRGSEVRGSNGLLSLQKETELA